MILTDQQWQLLLPFFPPHSGPGRPRTDPRLVLDAWLWRQLHSRPWRHLPACYPSFQVCHQTYQRWREAGLLRPILRALECDLRQRGRLDLRTCFTDGSLSVLRRRDGLLIIAPGFRIKSLWQYTTAMLFIAPALNAANAASVPQEMRDALILSQFEVILSDYLQRLVDGLQAPASPASHLSRGEPIPSPFIDPH